MLQQHIDKYSSSLNEKSKELERLGLLGHGSVAASGAVKPAYLEASHCIGVRKEYVCFQGDRYLNADKLLTCKFMGHEAHFPIGPFLLASRMKVPVVFYFAMREAKQTYHFHFILAEQVSGSKEKRAEQLLLEQYVNALEKIIGQYPEQWFNYYSFWKPSE